MIGLVYAILKGHEVAQALYGKPGEALWSFAPVTIYLFVLKEACCSFSRGGAMKFNQMMAKLATVSVVMVFLIVPLAVWFYDDVVLPSQYPDDAQVYTLYWSAHKVITADRINGWNYWQSTTNRLDEIRIRHGDRVIFRLISADVYHGFATPAFGITDGMIEPGDVTEVEFVADQVGSFKFFCTIKCGPMHEDLEATLTVLPADATTARAQIFR